MDTRFLNGDSFGLGLGAMGQQAANPKRPSDVSPTLDVLDAESINREGLTI
jgi:hypothetical protein